NKQMIMGRFFLFCSLILLTGFSAFSQTRADLEKQRAAIQREIDEVKQSLDQTKKNKKETLGQLSLIQKKLYLRQSEISNINQQMLLIQGDILQSYRDVDKLTKELDTLKSQYAKSVAYAYKNRSNYDFLNFIFSAADFNDALKRVAYLRSYRSYREQQAMNISSTQKLLKNKISGLSVNKSKKSEVLVEETKQKQVLEVEKKEKDAVVSKLKSREKELASEMAVKRKQDQKLASSLAAAIRRARDEAAAAAKKKAAEDVASRPKVPASSRPNTSAPSVAPASPKNSSVFDADPESRALSADFEKNKRSLPWPVESGRISMHFGRQRVEGLGSLEYDNQGITIETEAGKVVKAVFEGEVSYIFNVGDVQAVTVKHGKYFTTYSNLSSASVSKNQNIKRGQTIGRVAEKADGQGELEFLISDEKGKPLNPESWLRPF
ncbi:MAG: peptidoglycan DD-metalloendopeptidase family protein, partial [Chitinophagaceae bacterium]